MGLWTFSGRWTFRNASQLFRLRGVVFRAVSNLWFSARRSATLLRLFVAGRSDGTGRFTIHLTFACAAAASCLPLELLVLVMLVSAARFLEALTAPLWFGCCVSHHSGQLLTTHRTNFGPTSSWLGHGKDSLHSFHPVGSVFRCPVRRTPSFRQHRASLRRAGQGWICSWCCTTCVGCTVRATVGEHEATHGPAASVDRGAHCCGASSTPVPVISSS